MQLVLAYVSCRVIAPVTWLVGPTAPLTCASVLHVTIIFGSRHSRVRLWTTKTLWFRSKVAFRRKIWSGHELSSRADFLKYTKAFDKLSETSH